MYLFLTYYINSIFTNLLFSTTYQLWYSFISSLINVYDNSLFVILLISFFTRLLRLLICILTCDIFDLTSHLIKVTIPPQLSIGYNVIHPVLFYSSFIIIASIYFNNIFFFKIKSIWYTSVVALLLGGLWGLGNSVWGFFWVNDRIELILLFYIIVLLILIHSYWSSIMYIYLYQVVCCLSLLVLLARWNFMFTRHSFFNLSNLTNIFIVYIYLYYTCKPIQILKIMGVTYLNLLCWSTFILYCIQGQFKRVNYYSVFITLLHIFFFILGLSWLKYKEHNLIFLTIYNYTYIYYTYLSNNIILLFNIFYIYGSTKLLVFKLSIHMIYSLKLLNSVYLVFCSYPSVCSIILLLVSTMKIYIN